MEGKIIFGKKKTNLKLLKVVNFISLLVLLIVDVFYLIIILLMKLKWIKIGDVLYENIYNSYWYLEEALFAVIISFVLGVVFSYQARMRKYCLGLFIFFVILVVYGKYYSNLSYAY